MIPNGLADNTFNFPDFEGMWETTVAYIGEIINIGGSLLIFKEIRYTESDLPYVILENMYNSFDKKALHEGDHLVRGNQHFGILHQISSNNSSIKIISSEPQTIRILEI